MIKANNNIVEDSLLGSVLVRNCTPSFVVHTTLEMSISLIAECKPECNAAMKFNDDCRSLLFAEIKVKE